MAWFAVANGVASSVAVGIPLADSDCQQHGTPVPTVGVRPVERALQLLSVPGRQQSSPAFTTAQEPSGDQDESAAASSAVPSQPPATAGAAAASSCTLLQVLEQANGSATATSTGRVSDCPSPAVTGARARCPAAPARPRPAVRLVPAAELAQYGISL